MPAYKVLRELSDVAVGDDKTLTVPVAEGIALRLDVLRVDLTATATVGNRSIDVVLSTDGAKEIDRITLTPVVAASGTGAWNVFVGSADGEILRMWMKGGFTIQVVDTAAIDVLDTLEVIGYFEGSDKLG